MVGTSSSLNVWISLDGWSGQTPGFWIEVLFIIHNREVWVRVRNKVMFTLRVQYITWSTSLLPPSKTIFRWYSILNWPISAMLVDMFFEAKWTWHQRGYIYDCHIQFRSEVWTAFCRSSPITICHDLLLCSISQTWRVWLQIWDSHYALCFKHKRYVRVSKCLRQRV